MSSWMTALIKLFPNHVSDLIAFIDLFCGEIDDKGKGKAVLLHAMVVLGGRGNIAPTHS